MDHILVVDDEEYMREILKDALEHFGYQVTVASNGQEGLEYFTNLKHFNLVITDLKMPVMDGVGLANSIRNSERPNIPIIAITAHFGSKNIKSGLFNSILGKPFNLWTLIKYVKQTLET